MTDYRHAIEAQCQGDTYIIREPEDLLDYALQAREVSSDLLQAFCQLHPETSQLYLRSVLNERGVKLVSNKLPFKVTDKQTESSKNHMWDISEPNTIINLRLNEIIATFINLGHEDKFLNIHSIEQNYEYKHIQEFIKLGLLLQDQQHNRVIITDTAKEISMLLLANTNVNPEKKLFIKINRKGQINTFFKLIRNPFINVLFQFGSFRCLFRLLTEFNDVKENSFVDLLKYCLENGYEREFIWLFVGDSGTCGINSILDQKDICFSCPFDRAVCMRRISKTEEYNSLSEELIMLRNEESLSVINILKNKPNQLRNIVNKPILLKFLVRYGVTFYNKSILNALEIVDSPVYDKSIGQYCPFLDEWRLNSAFSM